MGSNNNPWKGLNFYVEGDLLYGRNRDIENLWQYISNNMQTVVYGKSGIGKTSLLNAGIFPRARQHGLTPVSIRLNHNTRESYTDQIKKGITEAGIIVKEQVPPINVWGESLWEFFHRNTFADANGKDIQPLIVLDQFEEIFTLQASERRRLEFFSELADLFNDVMPQYIAGDDKPGESDIESSDDVLSFDDISLDLDDGEAVTSKDYIQSPAYHFVFIIREDFLSYLERYTSYIPVMKSNRYALLPLNEEQAAEIIMRPCPGLVSKGVAELIIQKVTGRKDFTLDGVPEIDVDSAILSLYLSRLYDKRTDGGMITAGLVDQFGDNIIKDFYNDSIKGIPGSTVEYLEDVLLTSTGRRNNVSRSDILAHGVSSTNLSALSDGRGGRRLLRVFSYGGDLRVEFIHDILCPVVIERKQQRAEARRLREVERMRKEAEAKAEELRMARNREYNMRKRKSGLNVLSQKGRRLIDNALDIGEMRTRSESDPSYPADYVLNDIRTYQPMESQLFGSNEQNTENYQVFNDPLLGDAIYRLEFKKGKKLACTSDGIYAVTLKYNNDNISEIFFYGQGSDNGAINYNTPVYLQGGFCGIRLEYDKENRETSRTFLDHSGEPTECRKGYARMETTYDSKGNPVEVRYYGYEEGKKVPRMHSDGNYGFKSVFDGGGNEVLRLFLDKDGNPTTILTGVYGKLLRYDSDTFRVVEISNTDAEGHVMEDIDGFASEKYEYDADGRKIWEGYYDKSGEPMAMDTCNYGIGFEYDMNELTIRFRFLDVDRKIDAGNGTSSFVIRFNSLHQLVETQWQDAGGKPLSSMDNPTSRYAYDNCNRAIRVSSFGPGGDFSGSFAWDYNRKNTHVLRLWTINLLGELDIDADFGNGFQMVCGREFVEGIAPDAPLQICFLDKNRSRVACKEGFLLSGRWLDDEGHVVKEMFYDLDGNPMPSSDGTYGRLIEYIDGGQRITSVDKDGNPMANNNGVGIIVIQTKDGRESYRMYDIYGNPTMDAGCFECRTDVVRDGDNLVKRTMALDVDGNIADGEIMEKVYDSSGRMIQACTRNPAGDVVANDDDDFIVRYEYSDDGRSKTFKHYDSKGRPRIGSAGWFMEKDFYDDMGRPVFCYFTDIKGNPAKAYGCYGKRFVYGEQEKTTIYLGKDGKPADNDDGYAYEHSTFDKKGLQLSVRTMNAKGEMAGESSVKEYIDEEGIDGAYYIHSVDKDDNIVPDGNAYYYYQQEDGRGRTVKLMRLGKDKEPVPDEDGDYGYVCHYEDFDNGDYEGTTQYLDKDGKPHDNDTGFSKVVCRFDILDRLIKKRSYSLDGSPFKTEDGCFGYSYKHLRDGRVITELLDAGGSPMAGYKGAAFTEEYDSNDGTVTQWYYDADKRPARLTDDDSFGSYGEIRRDGEGSSFFGWLDQRGERIVLGNGAVERVGMAMEDGSVVWAFNDVYGNHIMDENGDYGTLYETPYEGASCVTSLDANGNMHNNALGYARHAVITDLGGNSFDIFYDIDDRQVLPEKLPSGNKYALGGNECGDNNKNTIQVLYPRQLGTEAELTLLRYKNPGNASIIEDGDYLVLRHDKKMRNISCVPLVNTGDTVIVSGKITAVRVPGDKRGFTFFDWKVTKAISQKIESMSCLEDGSPVNVSFNRYQ